MNFFSIDHTFWIIHNSYFQRDLDEINIFLGIQKVFFPWLPSASMEVDEKYFYSLTGGRRYWQTCLSPILSDCFLKGLNRNFITAETERHIRG